ncbi:MAG: ribosome small subunit-dependent GTPase A [Bulleidia sp.]
MTEARIIKIVSKEYTVLMENGDRHIAILSGRIRRQIIPAAGDLVQVSEQGGRWVITRILPRKSHLIRPFVANVDQALIVMSVRDPDFSVTLIDRLCVLIGHAGITPVLIITKCDTGIPEEIEAQIQEYERGPMKVIRTGRGTVNPEIPSLLEEKVSVLTGQSGAGKSTLINELEPSFHLATQEISKALGRGKHTTRHNELHEVCGGLVADTPGFSSLDFTGIKAEEVGPCIPDFVPYLGKCRFNDCMHHNEPECAVKQAVEEGKIPLRRYHSYLAILAMIQERRRTY